MFRCKKCNEKINMKDDEVFVMGQKWHKKCWSCDFCGNPLGYKCCHQTVNQTYCNDCFITKYGPKEIGYFMIRWNANAKAQEKTKESKKEKDSLLVL